MKTSEILVIIISTISYMMIVVFSVWTYFIRDLDPIRSKNIFLVYTMNLGYLVFGLYSMVLLEIGYEPVPDYLFPWPMFLGYALVVSSMMAGALQLYLKYRLTKLQLMSFYINSEYSKLLTSDKLNIDDIDKYTKSWLVRHAHIPNMDITYGIGVIVFTSLFMIFGAVSTVDYMNVAKNGGTALDCSWLQGSFYFAVIILGIFIVLIFLFLRKTDDNLGFRREYINLAISLSIIIAWGLLYFVFSTFVNIDIRDWKDVAFSWVTIPLFISTTFIPWVNTRYAWCYDTSTSTRSFWFKLRVALTGRTKDTGKLKNLLETFNLDVEYDKKGNMKLKNLDEMERGPRDSIIIMKSHNSGNFIDILNNDDYRDALLDFMKKRFAIKELVCLFELVRICSEINNLSPSYVKRIVDNYIRRTAVLSIDDFSSLRSRTHKYHDLSRTFTYLINEVNKWEKIENGKLDAPVASSKVIHASLNALKMQLSYNLHLRYWADFRRLIGNEYAASSSSKSG